MQPTRITATCRTLARSILLVLTICTMATADLYQYTDNRGTVCMTNNLNNVPPAKRKGVKVVSEDPKPQPPTASSTSTAVSPTTHEQSPAVQPASTQSTTPPLSPRKNLPWMKVVTGSLAALVLLFIVSRLAKSLSSPQFAKVIYVAFFLGTFVFGYKLYADHLVNGYFAIKGKFISLFAKAQQREGLSSPRSRPGDPEP